MNNTLVNNTLVNILTYNICWGCFTGSIRDRTARPLANLCLEKKYYNRDKQCWQNIIRIIAMNNYDLIATQESSNIAQIIYKLKKSKLPNSDIDDFTIENIKHLRSITYNCDIIDTDITVPITSFYNEQKFIIKGVKYDDIGLGLWNYSKGIYNDDPGRPILILLIKHIKTGKNIIFINVHNVHFRIRPWKTKLHGYDYLTYRINELLMNDKWYNPVSKKHVNLPNLMSASNKPEIILAGDFNNHYDNYLGKEIIVSGIPVSARQDNDKYHTSNFPNSCCDKRVPSSNLAKHNDLILASKDLKYKKKNQRVDNIKSTQYPASDHYPIMCQLEI